MDWGSNRSKKCKHQYAVEYSIRLGTLMDTYNKLLPINQKSLPLASFDDSNMEINARNLVFTGINPESSEKLKI